MNRDFIITKIDRVILYGGSAPKTTAFTHKYMDLHEVLLHLSGRSTARFNGQTFEWGPGVLCYLPKGEVQEYTVEREELGECIDIFFDTDFPLSSQAFSQKIKNDKMMTNRFKKLFALWVAKGEGYSFECLSLLYKIFADLQKQTYLPERQTGTIQPALDHINEHFRAKKIPIGELAERCGISQSYLKKLFIKRFGLPPAKYIIQLKINYACDLLRSDLYNITQVAEHCGYENVYYFSRQFKEYMGVSPKTFAAKYPAV